MEINSLRLWIHLKENMWEIYFYIMKRQAKIWHSLRLHAEGISNMPSDVNINMTAACKFRPVKMYVENILSQENSRNHTPIGSLVFVVKVVLSFTHAAGWGFEAKSQSAAWIQLWVNIQLTANCSSAALHTTLRIHNYNVAIHFTVKSLNLNVTLIHVRLLESFPEHLGPPVNTRLENTGF